jgi:5-formyltetrahydrofolate cyclo-ligase
MRGGMDQVAKPGLRREMRVVRQRIAGDPAERAARSARIWAGIVARVALPHDGIADVMMFDSLPGEPDTSAWMAWCTERGMRVFVPAVDGPDLRVVPGDVDPLGLDLVVVPGLAFTADGHRLGQGGGHYDRFLARVRPECVTVGVGFTEQLVDAVPQEPHDVRLHHVVTG